MGPTSTSNFRSCTLGDLPLKLEEKIVRIFHINTTSGFRMETMSSKNMLVSLYLSILLISCLSFDFGSANSSEEGNSLWPETVKDKVCPNFVKPLIDDVSSQQECQQRCIEKSGCVGISYSHDDEFTNYCYVCNDAGLIPALNNFGFYQRPEIVP